MRIWSLHPSLLDAAGLVALWREALLAQKVLRGRTKGYRAHPQLQRFRESGQPVAAIAEYLRGVHEEAVRRDYEFDASKIAVARAGVTIPVTRGQVQFEFEHLLTKLRRRAPEHFEALRNRRRIRVHPMFRIVAGGVATWEKV